MIHDVVVIGAGSAGLSCAHTLAEGGADYLLVSETLGGRIDYSPAEGVNFGAYFVMANYHHAAKLVTRRTWINPFSCRFHDGTGNSFATLSGNTVRRLPGFLAFAAVMARFIRHYGRFKRNCEYMSQREAMEVDPYIGRLFVQPASEFIARHHLGGVARDYVSKFSYACTGVDMDTISALDFLNVCQGLVVAIHRFEFDEKAQAARLGEHFIRGTVTGHALADGVHTVTLADGTTIKAGNVIFATPAAITSTFLDIGELRDIFTALQDDGSYLVYSRAPEIDLSGLFTEHEVLGCKDWVKAMYVQGRAYIEQQYGDSTYVAGDHNGLGLEPAAISGVYAARQVLKKLPKEA